MVDFEEERRHTARLLCYSCEEDCTGVLPLWCDVDEMKFECTNCRKQEMRPVYFYGEDEPPPHDKPFVWYHSSGKAIPDPFRKTA